MTNNPQTAIAIAIFLAVLVVGLTAIYVFTARDKQGGEQVKQRARAAVAGTPGTTFHNGAMAAIDGDELWENPHSEPKEGPEQHVTWAAGWCYGKQMLRQVGGQP